MIRSNSIEPFGVRFSPGLASSRSALLARASICACMYMYYSYMYMYMYAYYLYMYVYMYMYMCIYMYMYMHTYMHMCMYAPLRAWARGLEAGRCAGQFRCRRARGRSPVQHMNIRMHIRTHIYIYIDAHALMYANALVLLCTEMRKTIMLARARVCAWGVLGWWAWGRHLGRPWVMRVVAIIIGLRLTLQLAVLVLI